MLDTTKPLPNWCENTIKIKGEKKELNKFRKKAKTNITALSLEELYPQPKKEKDWYNWRIENWGTKWDIETYQQEPDGDIDYELIYGFDSAWSPPIEAFKKISKDFPRLLFILDYDEPGVGFKGIAKIKNGEVEDHCIDT